MKPRRNLPLLAIVGLLAPPVLGYLHARQPSLRVVAADDKDDGPTMTRVFVDIPSLPIETLTSVSTDVVRGRVLETRPVFPEQGIAYTEVDLDVSWTLKGMDKNALTIQIPGASSGTRLTTCDIAPKLAVGDEAILFLLMDLASGEIGVFGLNQGMYRIIRDDKGKEYAFGKEAQGMELSQFISNLGGK